MLAQNRSILLVHEARLNKLQRIEIQPVADRERIKLEIDNKKINKLPSEESRKPANQIQVEGK